MKKTSKFFAVLLSLVMVMSVTVALTSCSSDPATLEDYVADHPEEQEAIDNVASTFSQDGMSVEVQIKGNAIIYSFKCADTYDEDTIEVIKASFEQSKDKFNTVYGNIAKACEEETEIDGITVQIIFINGDGSEFYNETFEAKE